VSHREAGNATIPLYAPAMAVGGREREVWLEWFRGDPVGALTDLTSGSPVGTFRVGTQRCHVVADPAIAEAVLRSRPGAFERGPTSVRSRAIFGDGLVVMADGEAHRTARRLVASALRPRAVRGETDRIVAEVLRVRDGWTDGQEVDVFRQMSRLMLSIVLEALLGMRGDRRTVDSVLTALDACMRMFDRMQPVLLATRTDRFRDGLATLDRVAATATRAARSGRGVEGLLHTLVAARDGGLLTDQALRDHVVTLFQAAHEPLAVALAWTWYSLSRSPDAQAALHREVDALPGGGPPTAADVPRLSVTANILAESLRLFPPVWAQERLALRDITIHGARFGAGDVVFINWFAMGRDRRLFSEPDRFEPGRWGNGGSSPGPAAYLPFGAGPRACVGEPVAWFVGTLVLVTIAQRWALEVSPGFEPRFGPRFNLRPAGGIPMIVRARP
jgi:cytochrome P450